MLKVGLTGGIGSGKSLVAGIFNVLGVPVFDADRHAKGLMETDEELASSIKNLFGEESYFKGKLNRSFLASVVFNDPYKLQQLNALVHPATISAAAKWIEQQKTPYIIKEAALLFEAGTAAGLDYIIGVHAPQHLRIKRVIDRDNLTRDQVLARMSRQINEEIKMKLCDFVIVNDEQTLLIPQVIRLHEQFVSNAKGNQ
jgi:dephospho-CoA kinase